MLYTPITPLKDNAGWIMTAACVVLLYGHFVSCQNSAAIWYNTDFLQTSALGKKTPQKVSSASIQTFFPLHLSVKQDFIIIAGCVQYHVQICDCMNQENLPSVSKCESILAGSQFWTPVIRRVLYSLTVWIKMMSTFRPWTVWPGFLVSTSYIKYLGQIIFSYYRLILLVVW